MVAGPTLGMPNWPAQSWFRLSGSRVRFRRLNPKRTSWMVVGLIVIESEITTCRWLIGIGTALKSKIRFCSATCQRSAKDRCWKSE